MEFQIKNIILNSPTTTKEIPDSLAYLSIHWQAHLLLDLELLLVKDEWEGDFTQFIIHDDT